MNPNRCHCSSFGKFGIKMEVSVVLQLSDYSKPVVKIMPLEGILL